MNRRTRRRRGLTIIEVVASLFLLALVAVAAVMLISGRDSISPRRAALDEAPAAVDALHAALRGEDVASLSVSLAAGEARRVVFLTRTQDEARWHCMDPATLASLSDAISCLYVAKFGGAEVQGGGLALEFDVSLGWLPPLEGENADELRARLGDAVNIARYREMVFRKGLLEDE